jgi:molecular chaperone DnaK
MARDNKSIGRFRLEGIPSAPRGVPQIEVTFDIDANGILNVTAKDLGTGKEQKITITASSGLSEDEIKNMVKDAEAHAQQDKTDKEKVEVVNKADMMIYQTEKQIKELGDKIPENVRKPVENGIADLKKARESENIEEMKRIMKSLEELLMKFGEEIYRQKGAAGQGSAPGADAGAGQATDDNSSSSKEKVVDAEVMDDDK